MQEVKNKVAFVTGGANGIGFLLWNPIFKEAAQRR